jgi:ABC-type transport system involved in multi-copper enzyme maturation permease subunit
MHRAYTIARYTFLESVLQPIFALLISLGGAIIIIFGVLPFFTLGEDTKMYKSVALDVILLLVLMGTLFAASKSIYEEIEDRTMLTLMSKPVRRWEVMVGKYLGIILSAALGVAILGLVLTLGVWMRVPNDYYLNSSSLDDIIRGHIHDYRWMHMMGLFPQLVLTWLQISVLAAVSVALSTRFSLIVNLPAVILIYFAGNLTRFLYPISTGPLADKPPLVKGLAWLVSLVLPYLETFDLKQWTVMSVIKLPNASTAVEGGSIELSRIWGHVAIAGLYAIAYATFALCAGMWSFQSRELGGGEG